MSDTNAHAQRLEHHLERVLDAVGTGRYQAAREAALLYLFRIHRHDPPTVLTDVDRHECATCTHSPEGHWRYRGRDALLDHWGACTVAGCECTEYEPPTIETDIHASMLQGRRVERVKWAGSLTEEQVRDIERQWLEARADPRPPSPPPPPTTGLNRVTELEHERDQLHREIEALVAKLNQRDAEREREHGLRLYRAHAKCVAIHTNGAHVELHLDTDEGDHVRLRATHETGRAVVRAGLSTTPLILTLTSIDLDAGTTPPPPPTPDHTDTDETQRRHDRFF